MEISSVIQTNSDECITALAYDRFRKEIFSVTQGEKDIQAWDARSCRLLRTLRGHKGCVTGLVFEETTKSLFSVALDGRLLIWTEHDTPIQATPTRSDRVRTDGAGYRDQRSSLLRSLERADTHLGSRWKEDAPSLRRQSVLWNPPPRILQVAVEKLMCWLHEATPAEAGSDVENNNVQIQSIFQQLCPALVGPELCTSDNVVRIVLHNTRVIAVGGDGCLCIYEREKPADTFRKIPKAHGCAIASLDVNSADHLMLIGSYDGSISLWSLEGRCCDRLEDLSDGKVSAVYVPATHAYWIVRRSGSLAVLDPSGPTDITDSVLNVRTLRDGRLIRCSMLYAPYKSDLVLGATHDRKIIVWTYNATHSQRVLENPGRTAVESLIAVPSRDAMTGMTKTDLLTGDAAGAIHLWKYDAEKRCNVFHPESIGTHSAAVISLLYLPGQNCFACGGQDGVIRLIHAADSSGVESHPKTALSGHTDSVTTLVSIQDEWLVSGSHDKSLRVWDPKGNSLVHVMENAHSAPIECLEALPSSQFMASSAMHHLVKIWMCHKQGNLELLQTLNHRIHGLQVKSNARSLPKSTVATTATVDGNMDFDLTSLQDAQELLQGVLDHADENVPEVTQVRWVEFQGSWITAANDEMIRLWSQQGELIHSFRYRGGPAAHLFVDSFNSCILLSTLDLRVSVLTLDHPIPIATYRGHSDVVRSISYVPERDVYVTASWDGSVKLFSRPKKETPDHVALPDPAPLQRVLSAPREVEHNENDLSSLPSFFNTDYTQQWKTLELMEEYEQRHTSDWGCEDAQLLPSLQAAPKAPQRLATLLDDLNKRSLDEFVSKTRSCRQHTLQRRKTFRRVSTRRHL